MSAMCVRLIPSRGKSGTETDNWRGKILESAGRDGIQAQVSILDVERSSVSLSTEIGEKTEHMVEMLHIGACENRRTRKF